MSTDEAAFYDRIYTRGGYKGFYFRDALNVPVYSDLWRAAAAQLSKAVPVVDLGCGPGQFATVLRTVSAAPYTGYDFSAVAIAQAAKRQLADCHFARADLTSLALPQGSQFVCLEVLEHIEKDRELLQQLPTGASLVFSVPTFQSAGHVRVFPAPAAAEARYQDILTMRLVQQLPVSATKQIFLFKGVRR